MNKWLLIWCSWWIIGQANAQDTPPDTYMGYRIFVTNLEVYQKKNNWLRLSYIAHNTGREALPSPEPDAASLEVNFDTSLEDNKLMPFAPQLRKAFRALQIELPTGASSRLQYLKVDIQNDTPELATAYKAVVATGTTPKKNRKPTTTATAPVVLVPQRKATTRTISEKKQPVVVAAPQDKKSQPAQEPVNQQQPQYEYNPKRANKRLKGTGFTTVTATSDTDFDAIEREKANCPDLVISSIKRVEQSKRWLILEYEIKNIGKGSAALLGKEAHERDNVAVKAFMSGTPKISRGAISIGGKFIRTGKSVLAPGEVHVGRIRLDVSSQTRYTPIVLLTLDAFQTFREC
ncbi:MAG: hypothetical protein AAGK47_10145, partial [Bacteroidota bacterium]